VVISSELPELMSVSDRIAVMRAGRIAGELPGAPRGARIREDDELAESIMALAAREVAS
jgi:ABC-type sugar transport system ATPase subunit